MDDKNSLLDISKDEEENQASWLTTFCDITLLLLTFFILLISMSTINKRKFTESFSAIRDTFGGDKNPHITYEQTQDDASEALNFLKLYEETIAAQKNTFNTVRAFLAQNSLEKSVTATFDDGLITLRMPSDAVFQPGSEELTPEGVQVINTMRDFFLKNREQNINIRGYTDNTPVAKGKRYKNNWELSALRAVTVLRELLEGGIEPTRMTATGLGDLNPLVPNDTPENKAMNRRVEFILERKVGKNAEL